MTNLAGSNNATGIEPRLAIALAALAASCAPAAPTLVREDPTGLPLAGLTEDERARFDRGDALFEGVYRESQGLGPVYIRASCASCHAGDGRGPGTVTRMVVVGPDGYTPAEDQGALLPYGSVARPQYAAGASRGITADPTAAGVLVSVRFGPAVFGRGWIEAVTDAAIEREAARQAAAGGPVRGRVPRLADGRVGRFGVKSRVATLDEFAADAFRGDMGLTSPALPDEVPNPDGLADDLLAGPDLPAATVADTAFYVRALAMPRREGLTDAGRALFARAGCADCHAPSLETRADFALAAVAARPAEVYSDLLLHDMGAALADGVAEGAAGPRDWRTAPLIGLRHARSFLHDGRASTLDEAVRLHRGEGSEANAAVDAFEALGTTDREALLDFVARL